MPMLVRDIGMVEMDLHAEIMKDTYKQLERFFEDPKQAAYLYLDDKHKACSSRFASLMGYDSPEEWARIEENFPTVFVHQRIRERWCLHTKMP
jgi:hypothetical protein